MTVQYKLDKLSAKNKLCIELKNFVEQAVISANANKTASSELYRIIQDEVERLVKVHPRCTEPYLKIWFNHSTERYNLTIYPSAKQYQTSQGYLLSIIQQVTPSV